MTDIREFIISENISVREAMEQLDRVAFKVLFISEGDVLKAAVTDGDIRRWILSSGDLEAPVKETANYSPKYLINGTKEEAYQCLRENAIEAVPIVDEDLRIYDVVYWNENQLKLKRDQISCPVVVMAGGRGRRLDPYTRVLPKPLIPVGELPIAERIIEQLKLFGCRDFHFVVNFKKNMIKAYFNEIERDYNIDYAEEDRFLGTGGGLCLLKGKIDETFILTNCDILILEDIAKIYRFHKKNENLITMVCSLINYRVPYGVVHLSEDGGFSSMEEKPTRSFITNTGFYIVEPSVIEELEEGRKIDFPDIVEDYHRSGKKIGVYPVSSNSWMDMGQIDELEKMRHYFEAAPKDEE